MRYSVLSSVLPIQQIDAESFTEAAKRFVELQRNLDITNLILADRFGKAWGANITYNIRDNDMVAGITLFPKDYQEISPYISSHRVGSSLFRPVSPVNSFGIPVQPAGIVRNTSDGQQVLPVTKNNIAVGGVNMSYVPTGINMSYTPFGF